MNGHYPANNWLDFEWLWAKVRVTEGQKVKIVFLRITPLKIVVQSCHKTSLFSSLDSSSYDYGRSIDSFKDR